MIDLKPYRWIVVNSSAGKDSQVALGVMVEAADQQGVPRDRIVVSHQCLGEAEWPGTRDLAIRQAAHYGLRFEVSRYRNADHVELSLLDYILKRGKWPDNKNRYCTSDFKRGPGRRVIVKLFREAPGDMLNIFGFRSEESPARAKKIVLAENRICTTQSRRVMDYLPVYDFTLKQIWDYIHASGVPFHYAYALGMPRLSCMFCIFAPRAALMIAGKANPALLKRYVDAEVAMGHAFQNKKPLALIQAALDAGEQPDVKALTGAWNM